MNRVRRLAEELVNRYPTLFSGDFNKNKEALSQVTIVRTRSLRNQLAGYITKLMHERAPGTSQEGEVPESATIEERVQAEGSNSESIGEAASSSSQGTKGKEAGQLSSGQELVGTASIQNTSALIG